MVILILGGMDDTHACHVLETLRTRGVDVEMFDSRWFPGFMQLTHDPLRATGTISLPTGRRLIWEEISAVYWRCYNHVTPPNLPDPEQSYIAGNDARGLFETLLIHLPARWVNGWNAFQLHQTKPVQLAMVSRLGVPIPPTLLSNNPEEIKAFAALHPQCIFKPVQGGAHTRRLTLEHLTDAHLGNLTWAPVTIQAEVPGTNIRVFVAGERLMACEVRTEATDFRDDLAAAIVTHDLPETVGEWCRKAAKALELCWTGIDLRRTPEGEYLFLEANPSPMFMGFESRCGLPLTAALADLLMGS